MGTPAPPGKPARAHPPCPSPSRGGDLWTPRLRQSVPPPTAHPFLPEPGCCPRGWRLGRRLAERSRPSPGSAAVAAAAAVAGPASFSSSSGLSLAPDRPPPPPALPAPPGTRRAWGSASRRERRGACGIRAAALTASRAGTARSEHPRTGRVGRAASAPATTKGPGGSGSQARARARRQRPRRREAVVHFVSARQVGRGSRAGRGPEQGRGPQQVHRWSGEGVRAPRGEVGWSRWDISGRRDTASPPFPGPARVPCQRPRLTSRALESKSPSVKGLGPFVAMGGGYERRGCARAYSHGCAHTRTRTKPCRS